MDAWKYEIYRRIYNNNNNNNNNRRFFFSLALNILCHVMSCHVMSCHVMSCYVMLCYVMLHLYIAHVILRKYMFTCGLHIRHSAHSFKPFTGRLD